MARMLGFSEEDKQRIGVARQGDGKGVVRGVLGLPGRLVGGILGGGGGASEAHSATAPDDQVSLSLSHAHAAHMSFIAICAPMPISVNIYFLNYSWKNSFLQSFADLWVDFLLTETEREKRQSNSNPDQNSTATTSPLPDYGGTTASLPSISTPIPYPNQNQIPSLSHGNFLRREPSDSEFSTVPLTTSESSLQGSRLPPRY